MKKAIALLLALVLALSFIAACQTEPATTTDPTPDTPAETPDTPAETEPPDEPPASSEATRDFVEPPANWDDPYSQTVLLTAASEHGANWVFEGNDDVNNSPWTRLYKDRLNIEVVFEFTAIADEYDTRLNMAIAAGALPDVFSIRAGADPLLFMNLVDGGMLYDLTDAYANYASDRIRDRELVDPYTIQNFMRDGRVYALPRYYYGQIDQPWHMWVRKDWYEAEGSPEIRTVADLEGLAKAFMDNQGAAYGIHVDRDLQWLFRTAPMFGAYVGNIHENNYFWMPDDTGRLRPGISFPEFEVALENWARWYSEGLINPEFMTIDPWGDNGLSEVVNGRVGIQCWWQWWGWWGGTIVDVQENTDAYFVPFNLPTVDGAQPARGQIFFANMGATMASTGINNPAAFMKILSLNYHMVFSPDAGLTEADLEYYMQNNREHAMTPAFQLIDPLADMLQFQHVLHALNSGDTSELFTTGMKDKYRNSINWIENQEPSSALGAYLQMGFEGSAYGRSQHLFDIGRTVQTAMWGLAPAEFREAGSTGDLIMEEVMQIIIGTRPASDWPEILEQWYAQGGQIKEDAVNLHFG